MVCYLLCAQLFLTKNCSFSVKVICRHSWRLRMRVCVSREDLHLLHQMPGCHPAETTPPSQPDQVPRASFPFSSCHSVLPSGRTSRYVHFLGLLLQDTTNWVALNKINVFLYSSEGQKSAIDLSVTLVPSAGSEAETVPGLSPGSARCWQPLALLGWQLHQSHLCFSCHMASSLCPCVFTWPSYKDTCHWI